MVLPLTTCHRQKQAVPDAPGAFLGVSRRQWRNGSEILRNELWGAGVAGAWVHPGSRVQLPTELWEWHACLPHASLSVGKKTNMGILMALDFGCLAQISALSWRYLTSVF